MGALFLSTFCFGFFFFFFFLLNIKNFFLKVVSTFNLCASTLIIYIYIYIYIKSKPLKLPHFLTSSLLKKNAIKKKKLKSIKIKN